MSRFEKITDKNFSDKTKEGLVMVDFYADWCSPCKQMAPLLETMAEDDVIKASGVKFFKVDVDENPELSKRFNIMSIPTIILYRDNQEIKRYVGTVSIQVFSRDLKQMIKT